MSYVSGRSVGGRRLQHILAVPTRRARLAALHTSGTLYSLNEFSSLYPINLLTVPFPRPPVAVVGAGRVSAGASPRATEADEAAVDALIAASLRVRHKILCAIVLYFRDVTDPAH